MPWSAPWCVQVARRVQPVISTALLRAAPCLFGLFSVVALLYADLPAYHTDGTQVVWVGKRLKRSEHIDNGIEAFLKSQPKGSDQARAVKTDHRRAMIRQPVALPNQIKSQRPKLGRER